MRDGAKEPGWRAGEGKVGEPAAERRAGEAAAEAELIARAVAGDGQAFGELVRPYEARVYGLAYRICGHKEDAYDLAQEAFLKVYRALPRFRGGSSFSTWLYRVVANTCLDQLRRRKRSGTVVSLDDPLVTDGGRLGREVADKTLEPDEAVLRSETAREVQAAVSALPPDHRLAILLRDYEDLPYEQIALIMGCSLGTVKSRISRARSALRVRLGTGTASPELSARSGVYSGVSPTGRAGGPGSGPARGVDA